MESFLYFFCSYFVMKRLTPLVLLLVFLVACSPTNVVKIDDSTTPSDDTETPEDTTIEPSTGGVAASTTGKVATSCDDTDLNDPDTLGRVTVTYDDATTEEFYDQCPGMGAFITEYICDGNVAKSVNGVCKSQCLSVNVKDQKSCPGCKVAFCQ